MDLTTLQYDKTPVTDFLLKAIKVQSQQETETQVIFNLKVQSCLEKDLFEKHVLNDLTHQLSSIYKKEILFLFTIESSQQSFNLDQTEDEVSDSAAIEKQEDSTVDDQLSSQNNFIFRNKYELSSKFSFSNLLVTPENRLLVHSLESDISTPHELGINCFFIHGNSGAGKTHILHAAGWFYLQKYSGLRVKVVTGDDFITDFQTAVFTKSMTRFKEMYRLKTDVLLIDDIQALAKAKGTQLELFNLMNEYAMNGKKIIITSDVDLDHLEGLEDRLKSRLRAGFVFRLEGPSYTSKSSYLKLLLSQNRLAIAEDYLERVATHFGPCYRSVEGIVHRIKMLIRLEPTEFYKCLDQMFPKVSQEVSEKLSQKKIIEDCLKLHNLKESEFFGKSRKKPIIEARKECIKRLRNELNLKVTEIARLFKKDHTTILNALNS